MAGKDELRVPLVPRRLNKFYQALVPINKLFMTVEPFSTQTIEEINKKTEFITK